MSKTQLADRAIKKPSLLNQLNDNTMIKFAIATSKYDKDKAKKLIELKYPKAKPSNIVLFWEAIGILMPLPSFK